MEILKGMEHIFDIMGEGILVIDKDARIVYANKAYYSFLGMDASQLVGKMLRDVRPGARLPNVLTTGKPILNAPPAGAGGRLFCQYVPDFSGGRGHRRAFRGHIYQSGI